MTMMLMMKKKEEEHLQDEEYPLDHDCPSMLTTTTMMRMRALVAIPNHQPDLVHLQRQSVWVEVEGL